MLCCQLMDSAGRCGLLLATASPRPPNTIMAHPDITNRTPTKMPMAHCPDNGQSRQIKMLNTIAAMPLNTKAKMTKEREVPPLDFSPT